MPQADQNIANQTFPATRADLNNQFAALYSLSSGTSFPAVTVAGMWVYRTDDGWVYQRNAADSGWIKKFKIAHQGLVPQDGSTIYAAAGGTANALTLTLDPAPAAYAAGMVVRFKVAANNTGSATLNVNGLGAVTLKKNGNVNLQAGDLKQDQLVELIHDGTNFQLLSVWASRINDLRDVDAASPSNGQGLIFNSSTGNYEPGDLEGGLPTETITTGQTLDASHNGKLLLLDGTFTLDLTAAATLGDGWYAECKVLDGAVTIDPNGAELINGVASVIPMKGSMFTLVCDGTGFHTVGELCYSSGQQTITAGGLLTLAHGLGQVPRKTRSYLVCQTAEQNWSPGDVYDLGLLNMSTSGTVNYGAVVHPDDTNINVRYGSNSAVFLLLNKNTGGLFNSTNASWRYVVEAFA